MCGITAIISKNADVYAFLFQSLNNLQNRGYDSAGMCGVTSEGNFVVSKHASSEDETALEKMKKYTDNNAFSTCKMAIAHTRWATHGEVSDVNSHPHICYRGKVALVHNGIIENYKELKQELQKQSVPFKSTTDTEVIVNLISYLQQKDSLPWIKAIKRALEKLAGTWALAIMTTENDKLYFTRHGSPLIMVQTEHDVVVTSEVAGLLTRDKAYTRYTSINECVLYQMTPHSRLDCEMKEIHFQTHDVSPHPYTHWTLKEINEQACLDKTIQLGARLSTTGAIRLGGLDAQVNTLRKCDKIIILGCGTSFHAGLIGQHFFKRYCKRINVCAMNASEFDEDTISGSYEQTAVVLVSQSGETRDLIKCLEICKAQGVPTIGVVNVVDSMIARETLCGVYCNAGREVAVASTKSFTAQCIVLVQICLWFHQLHTPEDAAVRVHMYRSLKEFGEQTQAVLDNIQSLDLYNILTMMDKASMFVLGTKGNDTAIAMESALKIKEIAYVHCEGTYTGSLKHGPLALVTNQLPVICLVSDKKDFATVMNAVEEIKSRNGKPIVIGNHPLADIPVITDNAFSFLWNNMVLQYLAYKLSVQRGINPDMPRNLAKVVTVG